MNRIRRINTESFSHHLSCGLCGGVLVDCTTIKECMHSFCRGCFYTYLSRSVIWKCPQESCNFVINKGRLKSQVRANPKLQDIIYHLFPEVYEDEMKRRREFYSNNKEALKVVLRTFPIEGPYSLDEAIGVSDRLVETRQSVSSRTRSIFARYVKNTSSVSDVVLQDLIDKARNAAERIYGSKPFLFQSDDSCTFLHLKTYIGTKLGIDGCYVRVLFEDKYPVHPRFTLGDVPELFCWTRSNEEMRFSFDILGNNNDEDNWFDNFSEAPESHDAGPAGEEVMMAID